MTHGRNKRRGRCIPGCRGTSSGWANDNAHAECCWDENAVAEYVPTAVRVQAVPVVRLGARLSCAFHDLGDDPGLRLGIGIHVRPVLLHQGTLGALVQVPVLGISAQAVSEQQVVIGSRIADFQDVHMNIASGGPHHAMTRLPNSKFIASSELMVEVVLLGSDVHEGDEDIDDGLRCEPGHRG